MTVTDFSYDLTRLFVLKNMKKKKSDFPLNMKCQGHRLRQQVLLHGYENTLIKFYFFSFLDGQRRGEARETFFINQGPSKGACEVGPDRGEEFNTKFKVFCKEWQAMVSCDLLLP